MQLARDYDEMLPFHALLSVVRDRECAFMGVLDEVNPLLRLTALFVYSSAGNPFCADTDMFCRGIAAPIYALGKPTFLTCIPSK